MLQRLLYYIQRALSDSIHCRRDITAFGEHQNRYLRTYRSKVRLPVRLKFVVNAIIQDKAAMWFGAKDIETGF